MTSPEPRRNRLAAETSPYLLQHADNPVDWYPWGPEALDRARAENRPILLSIGYSACHWCHVMAHESFEDEATAEVMNSHFVNIKVDREERPDLDKIYQVSHQLLARRPGGWPLTMFLTPDDLTPFFGGTYFPPSPRHGLPAFRDLLVRVVDFLATHGDEVAKQNETLRDALARSEPSGGGSAAALNPSPSSTRWRGFAAPSTPATEASEGRPSFRTPPTSSAASAATAIRATCTWACTPSPGWRSAGSTTTSAAGSAAIPWTASG